MILRAHIVKILVSCALFLGSSLAFGQNDSHFRDIPNGVIVEGSSRFSGLQPDYLIDSDSEAFDALWALANEIRLNNYLPLVEKVRILTNAVHDVFSQHHAYNDPVYLNLLKEYRQKGEAIPLSKYVICGAGVCRENALVLHLILKKAGIPNFHVYAKTLVEYAGEENAPEDHGFVVFEYQNEKWIADSYFKQFNGYSFDEFMENNGHLKVPIRKLSFAEHRSEKRAIIQVNNYPKYSSPKPAFCRSLFTEF